MTLNPRLRALVLVFAILFLLGGCGYIGQPLPPLLNIPGKGENVTAVQRGAIIIAHVTLPTFTTEGVVIKQGLRLELRIGPKPGGQFNAATWLAGAKPAGSATTANGIAEYRIPATEWIGKQVSIAVKIIGATGRDAGWSTSADLTVVPPPETPHDFTAQAVPQGVRLTWQGGGSAFLVLRRGPEEKNYRLLDRSLKPEYIDTTIEFGKPYTYLVQSLVKTGDKPADGEAQSDLSNEAAITPVDTFPPATPAGLAAVPSTASIELAWERNAEPNVIGYRVYRSLGNGPFESLPDMPLLPAYSDHHIESGKTYRYAVSAVKSNKQESKMSEPVEVALP
jgi:hypothetical protein